MPNPKALSHLDICDSNCPLRLDRMVQNNREFRLLISATANGLLYRLNPPRRCMSVTTRSESDRSCAQSKCDRQ